MWRVYRVYSFHNVLTDANKYVQSEDSNLLNNIRVEIFIAT